MSGDQFTLTISQSIKNEGDFAIHLTDMSCHMEKILVQLQFAPSPLFDGEFMDEVVSVIARKLAKKIIDRRCDVTPLELPVFDGTQEVEKIVDTILENMRKQT